MRKDISTSVSPVQAIGPAVLAADNTPAVIVRGEPYVSPVA